MFVESEFDKEIEEKRAYFRNYQRKLRLSKKCCAMCGEQAYFMDLLTKQYLCGKHAVEPVKKAVLCKSLIVDEQSENETK